jgi:hypothetical protein
VPHGSNHAWIHLCFSATVSHARRLGWSRIGSADMQTLSITKLGSEVGVKKGAWDRLRRVKSGISEQSSRANALSQVSQVLHSQFG